MVDYVDRAITKREEDLLDRAEFVETLAKALINDVPPIGNRRAKK
jgi:hypothetical protein